MVNTLCWDQACFKPHHIYYLISNCLSLHVFHWLELVIGTNLKISKFTQYEFIFLFMFFNKELVIMKITSHVNKAKFQGSCVI
jgi:hypothetical protein